MAGLKCSGCGEGFHYHGMPNGIQYTVFSMKNWKKIISTVYDPDNERIHEEWNVPGPYLYQSDTIWEDFRDDYSEVRVCPYCGTLAVSDSIGIHIQAVYTPTKEKIAVDKSAEKYLAFSDYDWEKIEDSSVPVSEIPDKFKASCYVMANNDHVWLFHSDFESEYFKVYKRIPIAEK